MDAIILHGVKTHNLKNLSLTIPHRKLYCITGVSGSGKSSLAFDTLYAEGQRRYVESLSSYARQFLERMEKPDVESVSGISPAIAIEAKNVITNARSTVGTQTEINDYLRLLYARVGRTVCPDCGTEARKSEAQEIASYLTDQAAGKEAWILFRISLTKKSKQYLLDFLPEIERQGFSEFVIEGKKLSASELLKQKIVSDYIEILADRMVLEDKNRKRLMDSLELAYRFGKGSLQIQIGTKKLEFSQGFQCFQCGKVFREPTPNLFSFNSPLGACPVCQGFGRVITIDWNLVIPDERKSLYGGAIEPWTKPSAAWEQQRLLKFCQKRKIPVHIPWKDLSAKHRTLILHGLPDKGKKSAEQYFSVVEYFKYLESQTYKMHIRIFLSKYRGFVPCTACQETRLKPEALMVKISNQNIYAVQQMTIDGLYLFLENLQFSPAEKNRIEPVYLEIKKRVRFLKEVGLGYLTLARLSRTLSGGEVQRIHLATSLGSALVDTLYVLDEPSVGLHERDNQLLIRLLKELRDLGNTVVVVEHDRTMIEAADEIIDLGPGGGDTGGELLFQGKVSDIVKASKSLTGDYLSGRKEVKRRSEAVKIDSKQEIRIREAAEHNLKNIDVTIPLKQLVVITGVSGSGKSTLLYEILYRHYLRWRGRPVQDLGKVKSLEGFEHLDDLVMVDQSPIGRTPRSNPVTYLKVFDEIRKLFAGTGQARRMGFDPGFFSFNVEGGRCEVCKGDGQVKVEMHFLADVFIECEACHGRRFKEEILEVRYQGKNIDEVLHLTVAEALEFFKAERRVTEKLSILERVGLSYLHLGQSATTFSGGEAQRLKLASEMLERTATHLLYLFDEPTTGLHYHDIHYLLEAFDELLKRGHSIVVIEHNMEIIRAADYLIDLGPEGGGGGGDVVYQGPARGIVSVNKSYTGRYLKEHLERLKTQHVSAIENRG